MAKSDFSCDELELIPKHLLWVLETYIFPPTETTNEEEAASGGASFEDAASFSEAFLPSKRTGGPSTVHFHQPQVQEIAELSDTTIVDSTKKTVLFSENAKRLIFKKQPSDTMGPSELLDNTIPFDDESPFPYMAMSRAPGEGRPGKYNSSMSTCRELFDEDTSFRYDSNFPWTWNAGLFMGHYHHTWLCTRYCPQHLDILKVREGSTKRSDEDLGSHLRTMQSISARQIHRSVGEVSLIDELPPCSTDPSTVSGGEEREELQLRYWTLFDDNKKHPFGLEYLAAKY